MDFDNLSPHQHENNPEPKVTLLTSTRLPLETVYSVWEASKGEELLRTPEQIKREVDPAEVEKLFRAVIAQRIPIGEHVDFVFMIENVSVSWREQAVRHRIGTLPSPERVGSDIVMVDAFPGLSDSSWWSQSMRIQDMSTFASRGRYRLPATVADKALSVQAVYHETMMLIEQAYKTLRDAGVPMEDAREMIPLGAQHRISWKLNIGALQHIVGKRGCWILQLGIWGPVITGMVEELATKIHPIFRELVTPPCLKGDSFTGCVFQEEVRRRYTQDDALEPCPLHFHNEVYLKRGPTSGESIGSSHLPSTQMAFGVPQDGNMRIRAHQYKTFWGRDPYTGKRLHVLK